MSGNGIIFKMITIIIFMFLLVSGLSNAFAEAPPIWGDLEPGKYDVGFMTVEKYDYSRSFQPKYDYNGNILSNERARPIQVCIWYPAVKADDAAAMVYGEYVYPYPNDASFGILAGNMQAHELRFLHGLVNNNRALVQDIMNIKMAAIKGATPVEGKYPLIIYHGNSMTGFAENAILCEYLAGHGYVVATSHSMGARGWISEATGADIEAMTRDKEIVFSVARDLEFVDADHLGYLGCGFGGLTALIMQMRNREADAVAALEGSFMLSDFTGLSEGNPTYLPGEMRGPLFVVYGNAQEGHDMSVLDAFRYTDIFSSGVNGLSVNDFMGYHRLIGMVSRVDDSAARVDTWPGCVDVCSQVKMFFDAFVKKDEIVSKNFVGTFKGAGEQPENMTAGYREGLRRPPNEDEFVGIIQDEGGARGVELFEKFSKQEPDHQLFREPIMNALGYQLLQANRLDDALEVFRLNTLAYPNSANCWDSYAEILIATGDNETAMKCSRKVLEILPADSTTDPRLKAAIEANARERLGLNQQEEELN